jgi:hypothetical protein
VDVDEIVPADHLVDRIHFSRAGYLAIAQHILSAAQNTAQDRGLAAQAPDALRREFVQSARQQTAHAA